MSGRLRRALVHAGVRVVASRSGPRATAEDARRTIEDRVLRPASYAPPRRMPGVEVTVDHDGDCPVYTLTPTPGRAAAPVAAHLVYLHGGAYIGEIGSFQWAFVADLVRRTGATATVPVYRLAPLQTAARTVAQMADLVSSVVDAAGDEPVVLIGDSAGGGLALAVMQQLVALAGPGEEGQHAVPNRLVLVAPWLDVTMTHPDQPHIAPRDLILRLDYLAEAGRAYAGDLPVDDPRVSPLSGDLAGLPPTTVMVGTDDVLLPDARRFREAATAAGSQVDHVEEVGMQHAYPVFPLLPQSDAARDRIRRVVLDCVDEVGQRRRRGAE